MVERGWKLLLLLLLLLLPPLLLLPAEFLPSKTDSNQLQTNHVIQFLHKRSDINAGWRYNPAVSGRGQVVGEGGRGGAGGRDEVQQAKEERGRSSPTRTRQL